MTLLFREARGRDGIRDSEVKGVKMIECDLRALIESDLRALIAKQFFISLQRRGADKLLSLLENYGDTLSDAEMLLLLQEYNTTGCASYRPQ